MAEINTHADALRVYLSGALTDGGAQDDPSMSLGSHRSATEETFLAPHLINPIQGIKVDYVAGANGAGDGALAAIDDDNLAWMAPSGTQGALVAIANGETKIIEDGTTPSKYIRVTRTSAAAMNGVCVVRLKRVYNNALGFADITDAQRTAGATHYRALAFKNTSASAITNLQVWRDAAADHIMLASERIGGDGHFWDGTGAGEEIEPPVLYWSAGESAATGLQVGTVDAGETVMIWIARTIAADADATALETNQIHWSFAQ